MPCGAINSTDVIVNRTFRECGRDFYPAVLLLRNAYYFFYYFRQILILAKNNCNIILFSMGTPDNI